MGNKRIEERCAHLQFATTISSMMWNVDGEE